MAYVAARGKALRLSRGRETQCFLLKSKAGAIGALCNTDPTMSYPVAVDLATERRHWRNDNLLLLGTTEPELLLVSEHAKWLGSEQTTKYHLFPRRFFFHEHITQREYEQDLPPLKYKSYSSSFLFKPPAVTFSFFLNLNGILVSFTLSRIGHQI